MIFISVHLPNPLSGQNKSVTHLFIEVCLVYESNIIQFQRIITFTMVHDAFLCKFYKL